MTLSADNINALWGGLLVEEFLRKGVTRFFVSPGSRSTPLAVAVARHQGIKASVCHDERGAAFCALGYARASGMPAALIATSGTAAANYYPAVVEASMDLIPLIVLTADRPPELRHTGANQTIQQPSMFGEYVRWHFDMPCPDEAIDPAMVLTTADQALYRALRSPAGPVHLNCMFREPLAPVPCEVSEGYLNGLRRWEQGHYQYTRYLHGIMQPEAGALDGLASVINDARRGVLVVGRLKTGKEQDAVAALAEGLGWPVFSDVASGLRIGARLPNDIPYYDQLLLSEGFREDFSPEVVLHLGGQPTSKRLLQFLEGSTATRYVVVKDHPFRHDPAHNVSMRIEADLCRFCGDLCPRIRSHVDSDWMRRLRERSLVVHGTINAFLRGTSGINEIAVARIICHCIPSGEGLFLASSMPIRDMDMFADPGGAAGVRVGSNRGASGIDGTIASAAGYALGLGRPVTLLIGDMAFLHDLNSLSLVKGIPHPLHIVVINNNGGGIFSFLPIAGFPDVFEPFFGAPHGLAFEHAAHLFGIHYHAPKSGAEFLCTYRDATARDESVIIEVRTNREENLVLHNRLREEIVAALDRE
ncbi:MAG: 2-succinyl-5-enolpyruvyl-6-hydroxy-3-cyclohexene-1-carboxylic-acid synthase [bacterium]